VKKLDDEVDGQRVESYGNDIKYLMDEMHRM
jgi:hypothetical protein